MAAVSVVVPYDPCNPERAAAWAWVRARYAACHPGWEVIVGRCDGEWSKGAAVADAVRRAAGALLVVADADSFVAPAALRTAVERAAAGSWCAAHTTIRRLNPAATVAQLERPVGTDPSPAARLDRPAYRTWRGGGINVLRRDVWDLVGGIDPRFLGWGHEDTAFGLALDRLAGRGRQVDGPLWHLWHPPLRPARIDQTSDVSRALVARYQQARTAAAMRALLDERAAGLPIAAGAGRRGVWTGRASELRRSARTRPGVG